MDYVHLLRVALVHLHNVLVRAPLSLPQAYVQLLGRPGDPALSLHSASQDAYDRFHSRHPKTLLVWRLTLFGVSVSAWAGAYVTYRPCTIARLPQCDHAGRCFAHVCLAASDYSLL